MKHHRRKKAAAVQRTISLDELHGILDRTRAVLGEADHGALLQAVGTLHSEAWEHSDAIVEAIQKSGRFPND